MQMHIRSYADILQRNSENIARNLLN